MNFKIKKFSELTPDELYEILRIRNEVFIIEQTCIFQDCDEKDQKSYHLFCIDNGKIIAYLRILEKGVSYSEISIGRVLVDKKHRGKGLARDILLKAIDFIENNLNEKEIRISAQNYLVDFYKSLGFSTASDMYLEDGIPHIDMFYNNTIN
ncbi:GNAT family N-acetyltransferase [Tepidibacter hydrothermalis]|uniref:GNAT family N-acetyltransferase n=1 Tax=Tepidibacter hydrothermalis TaxID=3036126 RepID=A0ABY8EDC0_9FIRM|nr:GNAT family N-acetyltransferase [Tepidibacter hydrothermalis]WFD10931.1 GNAT family N-acetyltransferase [Tepidibacter hydrothermalis]